jgi:hypothetical protein
LTGREPPGYAVLPTKGDDVAKDLTVILSNVPGTFASMGEALGGAGINIDGICGFPAGGEGVVHLLVEDTAGAKKAVEDAGHQVSDEREVLVVDVEDKPGEVGRVCRKLAGAGVNLDLIYPTNRGQLVLGADDIGKARSAL